MEPRHSKTGNIVPTFEERVMKNIASIKSLLGGSFNLSNLTTQDKANLISAINELKTDITSLNEDLSDIVLDIENLSGFSVTMAYLESLNLVGDANNQLARGDHDHEVGDLSLYFENQLI